MLSERVVLITGGTSGIGKATAEKLAARGFKVFGTSRKPTNGGQSSGPEILTLDVQSENSVQDLVQTVLQKAGRLDVLINNAGYLLSGALEEATIPEARSQFETNFFGVVRVVNGVLPVMRQQKSGQIINISSIVGLAAIPFWGFYSASKFALEGYTEALRHEVRPFNVKVSLVEPGYIKTDISHKGREPERTIDDYGGWKDRALQSISTAAEKAPGPETVAQAVYRIATSPSPRLRYRVGSVSNLVARLRRFTPELIFEKIMRQNFNLS